METDPTAVCELLVGLGDVTIVGVDAVDPDEPIRVHVETRRQRPDCHRCETPAVVKDRPLVELVDLPVFGRPARLVWRKHRWACPDDMCPSGSWTEQEPRIAAPRLALTDRAGRWVTFQVGYHGRTVNEVAQDLNCDWHTVNDAVIAYGTALIDDDDRIGDAPALGLDETLCSRIGRWRTQAWSTQIVDVGEGRLLDVVEGRSAAGPAAWLAARGEAWCSQIRWATLDLSGPYRNVFDTMLPGTAPDRIPGPSPPRQSLLPPEEPSISHPPSRKHGQDRTSHTLSGGPDQQGGQNSDGDKGSVFTR